MLNFKKTLRTVLLFFLILILISTPPVVCYFNGENHAPQDTVERAELAGTLDYLLVGASHLSRGMIPEIIDAGLGVNSYNLSHDGATVHSRYTLMAMEAARNPVKTVVVDVSMNTMSLDPAKKPLEGDLHMISRLANPAEGFAYVLTAFRPWNLGWAYYHVLDWGLDDLKRLATGQFRTRNINQRKGYIPHRDETELFKEKSLKKLKKLYRTESRPDTIVPENDAWLRKICTYCQEHDLELILISLPLTQYQLARNDNLDVTYHYYQGISEEYGVPFYDFNLMKGESELFSDGTDFSDKDHLSNPGAVKFTECYVDIMRRRAAGEDISKDFYRDYEEMYQHMPYAN